jgi:DnaJ-class molecular chaperone
LNRQHSAALTLPPHSNSGCTLRLRGKGLPAAGRLLVTLRIVLPKGANAELEELAKTMQSKSPDSPRNEFTK